MSDTITIIEDKIQTVTSNEGDTITLHEDVVSVITAGIQGAAGVGVPVGGTTGQALVKTSGADFATAWGTVTSTPAGANTQIQYNNSGVFGASSALTFNAATAELFVGDVAQGAGIIRFWDNANADYGYLNLDDSTYVFANISGGSASVSAGSFQSTVKSDFYAGANIFAGTATNVPLFVQATTGQTANLQNWLSSTSAVLASIGSTGNATFANITGNPSVTITNAGNTGATAALQVGTSSAGFHVSGVNYAARAIATGAAIIPLTVRGAASQTANLLEIQNSAAAVQASFDASGNLTLVGSGTTQLVCQGIRRRAGNTNFLIGGGGSTATGTYSSITLSPITDGAWTQTSGTLSAVSITPSYNQASGTASNTDLLINRTQTAVGSGQQNLMDLQVGGVSRARIDNEGRIFPRQATTAGAPPYALGAIYFDTTLNKLRIGGATAWETVTSV